MREYTYVNESDARADRRAWIESGKSVSLIAYDPSRDRYTFDVYN